MRVLVVEDEDALADAIAIGLRAEGFDVDVVHDGTDGLWRAREFTYGAIVLDILLPGMNGYQVCRTLRAEANWTPIIMLTAKIGEWDEAEALDIGADDYLSKPFSFVVLVARLRALQRRIRSGAPAYEAGALRLDPARRECTYRDDSVDLTPREFALLEALIRSPGTVRRKTELLDEVWGADYRGDGNVVEVYVRYLRNKIDVRFDCRTIETVRGVGYRLVADE
ncbi:MAG TPA: response regulator transcription factor [Acidimicrobiales bacterium]|nr:response regulator transcription factor [Acidimicrobiales bacterium]